MKKLVILFVLMVVVVFSVMTGCSKSPTSGEPTPEEQQTAVAGLSYNSLVSVPGGTFTQTDTSANSFSHTISAFKMGKYEVSYELWYMVKTWAGANGYVFANAGAGMEGYDGTRVSGAAPTAAKYEPVTTVGWRDTLVWCNAYSQMTGLAPVYCSNAGYTTPIKISTNNTVIETVLGTVDNPYVNWSANGYRLPTEGEWQYAASYKDGSSWTPYNYASGDMTPYDTSITIGNYCWYYTNSGSVTHNVGGKTANSLGIYDMSGNVWEWCWDWYGSYPTATSDYRGPVGGFYRVIRGGSYDINGVNAYYLQVGYRFNFYPYGGGIRNIGFRFARTY